MSERSALVFIEFQNEWLGPDGALNHLMRDRRQFAEAVENAARVLQRARACGQLLAHAGLSLVADPDYQVFAGGTERRGLKGAIPHAGTWREPRQVAFPPPFTPRPGEFVVAGRSGASVLANSNLDPFLRNNRVTHLYLLGFALHVCVESTLRHAHDLGYEVTLISDACPAFNAEQRQHVLTQVLHHFGDGMSTAEWLQANGADC